MLQGHPLCFPQTLQAFPESLILLFFLRFYLFIFREGKGGRKRERNINVWLPLARPLLGTWLATQACALTGNPTGSPLVDRPALNPLSYTSQGSWYFLSMLNISSFPWKGCVLSGLCVCSSHYTGMGHGDALLRREGSRLEQWGAASCGVRKPRCEVCTSCAIQGKWHNFSMPQFPQAVQSDYESYSTCGLFWRLRKILHVNYFECLWPILSTQ